MVTAILLAKTERNRVKDVAERLLEREEITEVYSVSGRYDLIAMIRVREADELADLVTGPIAEIEGITDNETLVAFRAYSRYDLEHVFSLGLE